MTAADLAGMSPQMTAMERARVSNADTSSWMASEISVLADAIGKVRDLRKEWEYSGSSEAWTHRRSGTVMSVPSLADRVLEYLSSWETDTVSGQAYPMETAAVDSERLEQVAACLLIEEGERLRREYATGAPAASPGIAAAVSLESSAPLMPPYE